MLTAAVTQHPGEVTERRAIIDAAQGGTAVQGPGEVGLVGPRSIALPLGFTRAKSVPKFLHPVRPDTLAGRRLRQVRFTCTVVIRHAVFDDRGRAFVTASPGTAYWETLIHGECAGLAMSPR
ncbi:MULTISPECIES: hypothetical protein [Nocardia]|uniref:hypothetical protein n=1 Tax=Nocardia TaxID=1817 RepID=UPI0007E9C376|nr:MULTISPECIES: hypothetical protein [Nocardia]MBF6278392.1 hypothetical protein [Nocardia nova]OBA47865.1 hypothetical protein A5789_34735 [Nocardia sp. 852002-51101_SCH5132738]OBB30236.1 hypothetical protein A5748_08845 [Nocardia sp. 852002-51244_SCH5132740]OBF68022.1 hypothetical protein A9X06_35205 [Mycobacterium sp. 852002-51759_SCH5129042]